MPHRSKILLVILAFSLFPIISLNHAWASNQIKKLGMFGDWEVVSFYDKDTKSCSVSNSSQLNPLNGEIEKLKTVLFITNWPLQKEYLAISVRSFAVLQSEKTAWFIFPDNKRFPLTQSELDARPNARLRANILSAMQQHQTLEIVTYAKDGQEIRRHFQLHALDAALATLNRFCSLP